MSSPTHIPSNTRVMGRIETSSDLEIAGRCDGEIVAAGNVTVRNGAICKATIHARSAVIQGEVIGVVTCTQSIVLAAGARVVGDLRAPDVSVAPSAKVDGRVDLLAPAPAETAQPQVQLETQAVITEAVSPGQNPTVSRTVRPTPARPRGRTRVNQRALETDS